MSFVWPSIKCQYGTRSECTVVFFYVLKHCYLLILSFDAMRSVYLHKTNVQERYSVELLWSRFINLDCMYFLFYPQIAYIHLHVDVGIVFIFLADLRTLFK